MKSTKKKNLYQYLKKDFYIVGIGSSAGGLEALNVFFDNAPFDSGMAFVQHLSQTYKSHLSELIGQHTKMEVSWISDGTQVKPNCVYVIPPNKDLRIHRGILKLIKPTELHSNRKQIDSFFHSLAEDQKEMAIGIILSGTGTDGTLGLKDIKIGGGAAFVQEPKSTQFDGMSSSAIDSKMADYVLTPEKMSLQLLKYIKDTEDN
jgi:two-component system CheB/CheR fusion protein